MAVFDLVADARVVVAEDVEDGQDLAVVGHQGLADHLARKDQLLDHLEHGGDYLRISGVQSG